MTTIDFDPESESSASSKPMFEQGIGASDLPEEPISEETVQAFNDDYDEDDRRSNLEDDRAVLGGKKAWYRRPSPWWCVLHPYTIQQPRPYDHLTQRLLVLMPLSAMSLAAVAAPHVAVMAEVLCRQSRQDFDVSPGQPCESDPNVQATVAKLIAGRYPVQVTVEVCD